MPKAKRAGVDYSFLFMHADGAQLENLTSLLEDGAIKPVVDRVFPFDWMNDAMAQLDKGGAKGKLVVRVR